MKQITELQAISEKAHIAQTYVNTWGKQVTVDEQTQLKILSGLGYDISTHQGLIESQKKMHKRRILPNVAVVTQGGESQVLLTLGKTVRLTEFHWVIVTENQQCLEGDLIPERVEDERERKGVLKLNLPSTLPLGYHEFKLYRKRRKSPHIMLLIVTPAACYQPSKLATGAKLWGPSVQLYTLKSQQNWGIGDFGDLKKLVGYIAQHGGDFVGLNPIHALFLAKPEAASPYSPSSRQWLNVLYIDVQAIPEFSYCSAAQKQVESKEFQNLLIKLRNAPYVDYTQVTDLKMQVLTLLFTAFKQQHLSQPETQRGLDFLKFVQQGGESLKYQAAFDALHAHFAQVDKKVWGYPTFPPQYQKITSSQVKRFIKNNTDKIHFYMYLQWIALSQLQSVQNYALSQGMSIGLYRDLAVGVSAGGADAWSNTDNLAMDLSIGAPPDVLGPLGQNWGLPPFNPVTLKNTAYASFIRLLRANMQHCGALRIDHILGLLRLWLIPRGESAEKGTYVYYPVKDLLAILALESQRNQCAVIGEDLGTVPPEIKQFLADAGVYSYKVFFFEVAEDGGYISPALYPKQSIATLCTHDMPTLKGFWHCEDLKLGEKLGLYPDKAQLQKLFDGRAYSKQRVLDSLHWHGYISSDIGRDAKILPMTHELSYGMQIHLAAGNSAFFCTQLEDWLEMDMPVNIPGTVAEYPNWRRKLSADLEEILAREDIQQLTDNLTQVRIQSSKK